MRRGSGMCTGKACAAIDTEERRALHYAGQFKFDHADLRPPFRPESYADAVVAADAAGFPVIVVDSGSHVWAGDGGVLDWQDEELTRMAGGDYAKAEGVQKGALDKPTKAPQHRGEKPLPDTAHLIPG